jgi:hypothetical protein
MKRPSKHKVIVYRQLIQPICEIALVDQPTGFVYYYQRVDDPVVFQLAVSSFRRAG